MAGDALGSGGDGGGDGGGDQVVEKSTEATEMMVESSNWISVCVCVGCMFGAFMLLRVCLRNLDRYNATLIDIPKPTPKPTAKVCGLWRKIQLRRYHQLWWHSL